jgi:uncharacterized protein YoxC
VTDPLFWLVLSFLFVTVSLTIALIVLIPTLREIARAARSAEKLFETLRREFPPTLEAIRLTGLEITDLTDDLSEGVQNAGHVVKQVDQTLSGARQQAKQVGLTTRSLVTGLRTAWKTFTRPGIPPQATPEQIPAKRTAQPLPEKINGSHFIATANEVIEQNEQYPPEELSIAAQPFRAPQNSVDSQEPIGRDRD